MGYGHAKHQLLNLILKHFSAEREKYNYLHQNPEEVYIALAKGAEKARKVATEVLLWEGFAIPKGWFTVVGTLVAVL